MKMNEDELIRLLRKLKAGDFIEYTGKMIVMRDAAQRRISDLVLKGKKLPVNLKEKIVFYAGPSKKPKNMVIGSIGPTTSVRMDRYLELLYKLGVIATVGKGSRSNEATILCKRYGKVYFVTPSGAAAYLATRITKFELLAFHDLEPEAVYELFVNDFPLLVFIDSTGEVLTTRGR